jgi:hypothetical protein
MRLHGVGHRADRRHGRLQLGCRDAEFLCPILHFLIFIDVDSIAVWRSDFALITLIKYSGMRFGPLSHLELTLQLSVSVTPLTDSSLMP